MYLACILSIVGVLLFFCDWVFSKRLKDRVFESSFISAQEFLSWNSFLRKNDYPGCYVIMVYKEKPEDVKMYENIYIGQSIHVYQRVRQHLTGHGNFNVYQAWKEGKEVYITFIHCGERKLNVMEKRLIRVFHATDSFNKQRGGARKR